MMMMTHTASALKGQIIITTRKQFRSDSWLISHRSEATVIAKKPGQSFSNYHLSSCRLAMTPLMNFIKFKC